MFISGPLTPTWVFQFRHIQRWPHRSYSKINEARLSLIQCFCDDSNLHISLFKYVLSTMGVSKVPIDQQIFNRKSISRKICWSIPCLHPSWKVHTYPCNSRMKVHCAAVKCDAGKCTWFFTAVTAPFFRQSTESGMFSVSKSVISASRISTNFLVRPGAKYVRYSSSANCRKKFIGKPQAKIEKHLCIYFCWNYFGNRAVLDSNASIVW